MNSTRVASTRICWIIIYFWRFHVKRKKIIPQEPLFSFLFLKKINFFGVKISNIFTNEYNLFQSCQGPMVFAVRSKDKISSNLLEILIFMDFLNTNAPVNDILSCCCKSFKNLFGIIFQLFITIVFKNVFLQQSWMCY